MIAHANPTTEGLLAALRRHTNRPALTWSSPPAPLAGGFWAEMYIIELADPPNELDGRLVARIMPDPATAAFETSAQRHLTRCGFPVPTIRCAGGPSSELDRAWSVMEFAAGQPPLAGLSAATAMKQAPILLRRLPDLLAETASALHQCPLDGLREELADHVRQPDIRDLLTRLAAQASSIERVDLVRVAEHLAESVHDSRSICHGDLHPFNLLVDGDHWTLIDWSTAVIADPTTTSRSPRLCSPTLPSADRHRSGQRLVRSATESPAGSCRATHSEPLNPWIQPGSPGVATPTHCAPSLRSLHGRPTTNSPPIADTRG